jgi:hypothetical protein
MLLRWLRKHRAEARRISDARKVAERAFLRARPGQVLIRNMTSIFFDDGTSLIMQICDDWGGIPPNRSWWRVCADGSCGELTSREVSEIRPLPIWR